MKPGTVVEIIPISKRMKDRINSHGRQMIVMAVDSITIDGLEYDLLLESLRDTFSMGNGVPKTRWSGWVSLKRDCTLREVVNE